MPGHSDSGQVDDLKVHLEAIVAADTARQVAPDGESDEARRARESVLFRPRLRQRIEAALADLGAQAPGLSAAEVAKLTATRAGREALEEGNAALGRVDDHLQSVTGERNPLIGKSYGVHGLNPATFGGVLRSLSMCLAEDARLEALPQDDEQRELLFTPVVKDAVTAADAKMTALLGAKEAKRGDLSRSHAVKQATVDEGMAAVAAARQHLYANLPDRKRDRSLYDYGFRPIQSGGSRIRGGGDAAEETPEAGSTPA
jgi:hypothetical protein